MPAPNAIHGSLLNRRKFLAVTAAGAAGAFLGFPASVLGQEKQPDDIRKRAEESVTKGLDWLKKTQNSNGHWEAQGGNYPTAMTALAGMAFLMEGSTPKQGKYTDQVKKTIDWFLTPTRQQPNGLIAEIGNRMEAERYMYGHGFATLFLASVYGDAEDREQQQKIERCLTKAVEFIGKAQFVKKHRKTEGKEVDVGGWGYLAAGDGSGQSFDEGSVTITQLQALRAAKDALIKVSKEPIDKAVAYLEACTTPKGGIIYSYSLAGGVARSGEERPPLTAAAVACSFNAGQYKGELAKKWMKYCKENIPVAKSRIPHDEYTNYYMSQFVYVLGDNRYGEMFPTEDKTTWLTWSKYRDLMFPYLIEQQKNTGEWENRGIGSVFATAVNLTVLQLEKGILPIYRR